MKSLIQINKKILEEKRKYFENYLLYANKIKEKAKELLRDDIKVLIFGSIVKGNWGPNSDIDILIISNKLSKNWIENRHIRTEIKKEIGPFSPFQIHLARPEEFENWWKNFIKENFIEV